MTPSTWDKNNGCDSCLRTFLYVWAKLYTVSGSIRFQDLEVNFINPTIKECRLDKWIGHRKSSKYRWSNSGSANPKENTILKRPTYWIYKNILRFFKIDPYKGLNGDQYRAYFLYLFAMKRKPGVKLLAFKVLFGFVLRLGFTPSLCEWMPVRPQAYILLFDIHWITTPLFWLTYPIYSWRANHEINKVSVDQGTTNKITLIPTIREVEDYIPGTNAYIHSVYNTYFGKGDSSFIGKEVIKALTHVSY